MNEIDAQLALGVELFNRGEFFEAHEAMEDAMNLLDNEHDAGDWDFCLGLLRASVANHKLGDGELSSARLHLRAALKFLAPYPDRHRGIKLREFRSALTAELARLDSSATRSSRRASSSPAEPQLNMIRFTAEFVASAFALDGCPRWKRAEVALAGRSNVGKSSLLNALAGVKGLARTSKTPGRTRCLNFFAVGATLALCDLPGFGYAKMGHEEAAKIAAHDARLHPRARQSRRLAILIDCRRGPQRDELDLAAMAAGRGIEVIAGRDQVRQAAPLGARRRAQTLRPDARATRFSARRLPARESTSCAAESLRASIAPAPPNARSRDDSRSLGNYPDVQSMRDAARGDRFRARPIDPGVRVDRYRRRLDRRHRREHLARLAETIRTSSASTIAVRPRRETAVSPSRARR